MNVTALDNEMSKPVAFILMTDSTLFKQNVSHEDVLKKRLKDLWFKFKTARTPL